MQYDATVPGLHGGGGEYEVQFGFGWTNGIIMDLLYKYPSLTAEDVVKPDADSANSASKIATSLPSSSSSQITLIALLVSLTAGFIG